MMNLAVGDVSSTYHIQTQVEIRILCPQFPQKGEKCNNFGSTIPNGATKADSLWLKIENNRPPESSVWLLRFTVLQSRNFQSKKQNEVEITGGIEFLIRLSEVIKTYVLQIINICDNFKG